MSLETNQIVMRHKGEKYIATDNVFGFIFIELLFYYATYPSVCLSACLSVCFSLSLSLSSPAHTILSYTRKLLYVYGSVFVCLSVRLSALFLSLSLSLSLAYCLSL